MNTVFDQMLAQYEIRTISEKRNAIHEVMQQITLLALNRAGFFDVAAFYGGTCLRIFYGMERFSEDLDFSLLQKNKEFNLETYFDFIKNEFNTMGRNVEISRKIKKQESQVESAFLKDTTEIYTIEYQTERSVKIKIEVDKDPPLLFQTEYKLQLLPYSFMTRCFTLPGLFAGKLHAFLFRNWENRVKGRDWYDLEWYVRKGVIADFNHLKERALQSGYTAVEDFTTEVCINLIKKRIQQTTMELVKEDVLPFLKNPEEINIWSIDYFLQLVEMIKFAE